MTLYADVKHTGQVVEAEEDGILETSVADIFYKSGELIFYPIVGDPFIVTEGWIEGNHIPVERKAKPKTEQPKTFEQEFVNAYANWNGSELNQTEEDTYIDKKHWNLQG